MSEAAEEIREFLDAPPAAMPAAPPVPVARRMIEALLDPRSIQWMLTLGGGLAVLGLIIWLVSLGVFQDPLVLAIAMGVGTAVMLAAGWFVALRTQHKTAGHAITFLACVVAPLNLWFYDAQGLVTLEKHLWVGGLVCSLAYIATVYVLRGPQFLYAVELGVTLTSILLLADLGTINHTAWFSLLFLGLALVSIHAERAFAPEPDAEFSRERYGLPLFWSGHVQLGVAIGVLLFVQTAGLLVDPAGRFFGYDWSDNPLIHQAWLAAGIWLAAAYAYLYSDFIVRRIGVYVYAAAVCIVLGEVTLAGGYLHAEGVIAVLAVTALVGNIVAAGKHTWGERIDRAVLPLTSALGLLPILLGVLLHLRATSVDLRAQGYGYDTGWLFVGAMLLAAACNRASAWLCQDRAPQWAAAHLFLSAAGLLVAAAGMLRLPPFDLIYWSQQAPILMLIPIGYLAASRAWAGRPPEHPLYAVAQTSAGVILLYALFSSQRIVGQAFVPVERETTNLLLGLVFTEAAIFYAFAAVLRRGGNLFLATLAACAAVWQLLGYFGIAAPWYTMFYAILGLVLLIAARTSGLEVISLESRRADSPVQIQGAGVPLYWSGNAVLCVALLAAILQGLSRLAVDAIDGRVLFAVVVTALSSLVASWIVPTSEWRRVYMAAFCALTALAVLILNRWIDLTMPRKLEILAVLTGTLLIVAGYIDRFRDQPSPEGPFGLLVGSMLVTCPLFFAMAWYRSAGPAPSFPDELVLITTMLLLLVTGCAWKVKSTTLFGGATLFVYLAWLIVQLAWRPQVAVGVYLAAGGLAVFAAGVLLSVYRDRLLELPERIARREGVFRVLDWR